MLKPLTANYPLSLNTNSPSLWLALYFFLNLSLTLYNKSVLIHFPFPYTLTAIHALCGSIGTWLLLRFQLGGWRAVFRLSPPNKRRRKSPSAAAEKVPHRPWTPGPGVPSLDTKESIVLFLFSILYTINIVVSNASLRLVTVPFHQVVRAATPFFTLLFSAIILRNNFKCTTRKALSLVPVVAGVGLATYGDYYFTTLGFLLTLLGTVLAALKTIITHLILIKPSPSPSSNPTLPLHSPVAYAPVPLPPSSEKENAYYRHRTPLTTPIENPNDSLLLSASQYPPTPYSPTAHTFPPPQSSPPPSTLSSKIPKLKLTPLHLLYLLSPLAFFQTTLLAHFTGELERVAVYLASLNSAGVSSGGAADAAVAMSGAGGYLTKIGEWVHLSGLGGFQLVSETSDLHHVHISSSSSSSGGGGWGGVDPRLWLILNGLMAFLLNVVSFNANRRVGALGMTVAANVKQVLTILLAVGIFDLTITVENGLGVGLTILGGGWYAFVEFGERKERRG